MPTIDRDSYEKLQSPTEGGDFAAQVPPGVREELKALHDMPDPTQGTMRDDLYPVEDELEIYGGIDRESSGAGAEEADRHAVRSADSVSGIETRSREEVRASAEILVQGPSSGGESLLWQLSEAARSDEADPESANGEPHQPDGGVGAKALAAAHATRVQARLEAGDAEALVVACEVDSRHGVGIRDFLDGVKEYDQEHGTKVYEHTKPVVLCTEDRREVIETSGILKGHGVEYGQFDSDNLRLPQNTGTILLDGTLNRQPAHQLHQKEAPVGPSHIKEKVNSTVLAGADTPLVTVDPTSGQAKTIPAVRFHEGGYIAPAKDPKGLYKYMPQLAGRIGQDAGGYLDPARVSYEEDLGKIREEWQRSIAELGNKENEQVRAKVDETYERQLEGRFLEYLKDGAYRSLGDGLNRQEDGVREFMNRDDVPPDTAVNYSPKAIGLLRQLAEQARPDALILASGPKRDELDVSESKLPPSKLASHKGSLMTNLVERTLVYSALGEEGKYFSRPTKPGEHGHILVDLSKEGSQIWTAQQAFGEVSSRPRESAEEFMSNARRKLTQYADRPEELPDGIRKINNDFKAAVEENPHVASDFTLTNELAQLFNKCGEYDKTKYNEAPAHAQYAAKVAMNYAQRAATLVPSASAPQLEIARAGYSLGEYAAATDALGQARQLSPRNADIYGLGMRVAIEQGDISGYIDHAKNYLHYNPNTNTKQTVDNLRNLCEAMSIDYDQNAHNTQPYKTILSENTETGERTLKAVSVARVKQIQAADAWLAAQAAAEELLNSQPYDTGTNQERDRIATTFAEGYNKVRPYVTVLDEQTGQMTLEELPRDSWLDRPPVDSSERYVYVGSMFESDVETPPQALYDMMRNGRPEVTQEKAARGPEAYKFPPHEELVVGSKINSAGEEAGNKVAISIDKLALHGFVSGQSGVGKTEFIKGIMEQFDGMGLGWTVINASNKPGEYDDVAARMEGQGVRVIKVGVDPISLGMLDPNSAIGETEQVRVKKTMEDFKEFMETAYGLPSPLNTMFDKVVHKVFAANGWDTGNPDHPVANMMPTVPTIEQFEAEWPVTVEKDYEGGGKIGEQSGLMRGFVPNRLHPLKLRDDLGESTEAGSLARAVVDGPVVDMEAIVSGKTVLEFAYIADVEQRRLATLAWTKRISDYMTDKAQKEGYNKGVRHVNIIDEAQNVVPAMSSDPGEAQSEAARAGAVKAFATQILEARATGISYIVASQQPSNVHPAFRANKGWSASFAQTDIANKEHVAQSSAGTGEEALKLQEILHNQRIGEALVSATGMGAVSVRIPHDPDRIPSIEHAKRAVRDQPPLPVVVEKVDHKAVAETAASSRMTSLRLTVEAEIMAALTGTEQPPDVLPETRAWWQRTAAENPDFARQVVGAAVGRAVDKRGRAIRDGWKTAQMGPIAAKYQQANATTDSAARVKLKEEAKAGERTISKEAAHKPQVLAKEVFATVVGKLNGEPTGHNRHANAKHVLPQIAVLKPTVDIVAPHFRRPPADDNFAKPLPHKLPGKKIPDKQRVRERRETLENHALSITRWVSDGVPDNTNKNTILHAILGGDGGTGLFYDLDVYADGRVDAETRRSMLAAGLGSAALHDPGERSFTSAFGLPAYFFAK